MALRPFRVRIPAGPALPLSVSEAPAASVRYVRDTIRGEAIPVAREIPIQNVTGTPIG